MAVLGHHTPASYFHGKHRSADCGNILLKTVNVNDRFLIFQLAEIKRTSEQYNDELDKAIDAMNGTISEQVDVNLSLTMGVHSFVNFEDLDIVQLLCFWFRH